MNNVEMKGTIAPPVVFISYSHDSKEHKAWVAQLALNLRAKGIEVFLDQFDLEPGDDVPKYMERSVAEADCVLMICTEPYVRKADDGKGGVGYETMVVSGELVKNLGQKKFVPVLRQSGEDRRVPRCVSTRLYVDLSDEANFDANFGDLVHKIHKVPKLKKGPLGPNPFINETFEGEAAKARKEERRFEFSDALSCPESAYERSLDIIGKDDKVAWRRFLRAAREKGIKALLQLYSDSEGAGFLRQGNCDWPELLDKARKGVSCYVEFIACLTAAAESGNNAYAGQLSWIDELCSQSEWITGGFTFWLDLPHLIFFVTQVLVGAMLMDNDGAQSAYGLATAKIATYRRTESLPLFSASELTGWPYVLDHHCGRALDFLNWLIDDWKWLSSAFGGTRRIQAGISAYYLFLSLLNFLSLVKRGELKDREPSDVFDPKISVPLNFILTSSDVAKDGYQLLLRQSEFIEVLLQKNGIDQRQLESLWPTWIKINYRWIQGVSAALSYSPFPHVNLPSDLRRGSYEL